MATERRYLKGDTVEVVEFPDPQQIGKRYRVDLQYTHNGVILGPLRIDPVEWTPLGYVKHYAHQVKLVKRPWWNWLRLVFVKKVVEYQRSSVR
jgi:hypothetical protein